MGTQAEREQRPQSRMYRRSTQDQCGHSGVSGCCCCSTAAAAALLRSLTKGDWMKEANGPAECERSFARLRRRAPGGRDKLFPAFPSSSKHSRQIEEPCSAGCRLQSTWAAQVSTPGAEPRASQSGPSDWSRFSISRETSADSVGSLYR